jgi:hypothetical protein
MYVKIYLSSEKSSTICIIDNIKFALVTNCDKKYILVKIGSKKYKLCFFNDSITNSSAISLLKHNCSALKLILYALNSNQKMILNWIHLADKMLKCKYNKKSTCKK